MPDEKSTGWAIPADALLVEHAQREVDRLVLLIAENLKWYQQWSSYVKTTP